MKALTLYQPWATLVAIGAKRVETRNWTTSYRGQLAIHVSKTVKIDHKLWWSEPYATALQGHLVDIGEKPTRIFGQDQTWNSYRILKDNLHPGCVIAVCNLIDIRLTDRFDLYKGKTDPRFGSAYWQYGDKLWAFTEQELAFGDYSKGRYLWFLDDVKLVHPPVPVRGYRRLWEW